MIQVNLKEEKANKKANIAKCNWILNFLKIWNTLKRRGEERNRTNWQQKQHQQQQKKRNCKRTSNNEINNNYEMKTDNG